MRIARDIVATALVAAVAITYVAVLGGTGVWIIADPRGVAAVGLVVGLAACIADGEAMPTIAAPWRTAVSLLVPVLVAAGIVTLVTNSWVALAVFMAALALLWAGTTVRHVMTTAGGATSHTGAAHA